MKNNLKNILNEKVQKLLTEESLNKLENSIRDKIAVHVEAALVKQDELYSGKLEELLEQQDKTYATKMRRLITSIEKDRAKKLQKVIKHSQTALTKEAKEFKNSLVKTISEYLELYLEEAVPLKDIEQATKNKTAYRILQNLRQVLAVDSSLMKEQVKNALIDGKKQIDNTKHKAVKVLKENKKLKRKLSKQSVNRLLEEKTHGMSFTKKSFLTKVFADKSSKFINENFNYTSRLFDKEEEVRLENLKEEALNKRHVKPDVIPLNENVNNHNTNTKVSPYVEELNRVR